MSQSTLTFRRIRDIRTSHPSQDGDGVKILRLHDFEGGLDPFLMLDELGSDQPDDYIRGFPPHPHRGMQTLTYVIHGGLTHEDHLGHSSTIHAGDAQWMHTGRGMIHSEMPLTDAQGLHAFQLWSICRRVTSSVPPPTAISARRKCLVSKRMAPR